MKKLTVVWKDNGDPDIKFEATEGDIITNGDMQILWHNIIRAYRLWKKEVMLKEKYEAKNEKPNEEAQIIKI